jgi:hypothetical protein
MLHQFNFSHSLPVYPCLAFKKYIGTSKVPFRALLVTAFYLRHAVFPFYTNWLNYIYSINRKEQTMKKHSAHTHTQAWTPLNKSLTLAYLPKPKLYTKPQPRKPKNKTITISFYQFIVLNLSCDFLFTCYARNSVVHIYKARSFLALPVSRCYLLALHNFLCLVSHVSRHRCLLLRVHGV